MIAWNGLGFCRSISNKKKAENWTAYKSNKSMLQKKDY